ncbi:hypothetical protein [Fimbriiglobus ruber]|uniref:Uncharacterized protein n=1 Tax=Fimbriiglobus ruber TaxID=1908690 RepID=A0A225E2V4_9BACT|nr:hypothetical protein [Fimbriiglobus ruber]OWK47573.1 hypothetical protein FRUB_01272 [Fimbriiglobus ruber]
MFHVFNTMANSTRYIKYRQAPQKDLNIAERSVLIKGGSGMHQNTWARRWASTPPFPTRTWTG